MNNAERGYFDWMCNLVGVQPRYFGKLMQFLNNKMFYYSIAMDGNRYEDGISLRYRFGLETGIDDYIIANEIDNKPCSVLEMMVALALKCEEHIMGNPDTGNRVALWFKEMLDSLGLSYMNDAHFDESVADQVVERFLRREYSPDGRGGLFTVPSTIKDMRQTEIWTQANLYFNNIW